MHTYWIVAPNEAQTTEYEHHYSREHAREIAEGEGGVAARPVREDVMSEDAEVCPGCSPLESGSGGDTSASGDDTTTGSESTENVGEGAEAWTCAGTTADDEPCTREVEEEGAYCFQHS